VSLQEELPSPSRQGFTPKSFGACCWPRAESASGCKIWALGAIGAVLSNGTGCIPQTCRAAHPTSDNPRKAVLSIKKFVFLHIYIILPLNAKVDTKKIFQRVPLHCTAITDPKFAISKTHLASGYLRNQTWNWSYLLSGISEPPSQSGSLAHPHQPSKLTLPPRRWWEAS